MSKKVIALISGLIFALCFCAAGWANIDESAERIEEDGFSTAAIHNRISLVSYAMAADSDGGGGGGAGRSGYCDTGIGIFGILALVGGLYTARRIGKRK